MELGNRLLRVRPVQSAVGENRMLSSVSRSSSFGQEALLLGELLFSCIRESCVWSRLTTPTSDTPLTPDASPACRPSRLHFRMAEGDLSVVFFARTATPCFGGHSHMDHRQWLSTPVAPGGTQQHCMSGTFFSSSIPPLFKISVAPPTVRACCRK